MLQRTQVVSVFYHGTGMKIVIAENEQDFDREGALFITRQALKKPDTTFGVATGDTTRNIYTLVAELHRELKVDYSLCKTCNLDEYTGVSPDNPHSCRYRINEILLNKINIKPENTYIPDGLKIPPEEELKIFKEKIQSFGGIDLLVLGVGTNGHIGFNEPDTPFDSTFRINPLTEDTRKDKVKLFGNLDKVPKSGITMGIRDIMMAREILLVAKGKSKSNVVREIVHGALSTDIPATVVKLHLTLTILVDKDAASLLSPGNNGTLKKEKICQ
jgi:glucosamine-6-phosphate deaminase